MAKQESSKETQTRSGQPESSQSNYSFESTDIVLFIWKKKVPLLIITIAAAVISTLVSFTITPLYKSTVVMFPASESPVSKSLFQPNYQDRIGLLGFGDELQLERILQVLSSDEIRERIIEKYSLMDHYEIDSTTPYPYTKLFNMYKSNIDLRRTEFNSIVVEVLDKEPQMAADIANDISHLIDSAMNRMKQERANEAYEMVVREYNTLEAHVFELRDSIQMLNKKGMVAYDRQIERLTEAYGKAIGDGHDEGAIKIKKELDKLAVISAPFAYYWSLFSTETNRLREMKTKYVEVKADAEMKFSNVFILDKAYKAEKKAYPKKSVIVLVATLSTFFLAIISFLFFESFMKKIRS
jgi:capsular polysaccharide biosynthesis protein